MAGVAARAFLEMLEVSRDGQWLGDTHRQFRPRRSSSVIGWLLGRRGAAGDDGARSAAAASKSEAHFTSFEVRHAGTLLKKSDWLKDWNVRFFVLTTEELVWFKARSTSELFCANGRFSTKSTGPDARRALPIHAGLNASLTSAGLSITGPGVTSSLILRAGSDGELGHLPY